MRNLWQILEEETMKAQEEKKEKEKEIIVEKQYNNVAKEFEDAFDVIQANYVFNWFLIDIFPKYIKTLIENSHEALLQGNNIIGKISLFFKPRDEFKKEAYHTLSYLDTRENCSDKLIYSFDANEAILMFKDSLIYSVFKEKLNQFLIKNQIISVRESKNSNLISYANPIYFEAIIEDLIKAYENGTQQIEEEKEDLKILMDIWNIGEDYTESCLGIKSKYYKDLMAIAKKEKKLTHKK